MTAAGHRRRSTSPVAGVAGPDPTAELSAGDHLREGRRSDPGHAGRRDRLKALAVAQGRVLLLPVDHRKLRPINTA